MRQAAERCLDATYNYRHIGPKLLKYIAVNGYGPVGSCSGTAVGGIGIVVPKALGSRIVVDHRIHGPGVYGKIEPWSTQFAEVPQVISPVGLGHYRHAVAGLLEPAGYTGSTETRMVHKGVSGKEDHIDVVPPEFLHLLDGGREHICLLVNHIRSGSWIPRIPIALRSVEARVPISASLMESSTPSGSLSTGVSW